MCCQPASLVSVRLVKLHLQSVSDQTIQCPGWKWGSFFWGRGQTNGYNKLKTTSCGKKCPKRRKKYPSAKIQTSFTTNIAQWRKTSEWKEKSECVFSLHLFWSLEIGNSLRELCGLWSSSIKNQAFSFPALLRFTIENQLSVQCVCVLGRDRCRERERSPVSLYRGFGMVPKTHTDTHGHAGAHTHTNANIYAYSHRKNYNKCLAAVIPTVRLPSDTNLSRVK